MDDLSTEPRFRVMEKELKIRTFFLCKFQAFIERTDFRPHILVLRLDRLQFLG